MHLAMVARRRPVCIDREASVAAASRLMREQHVDEVVVTERLDGKPIPAGIVSARDIVARVVAVELDASVLTVGDILWSRPIPVHLSDSVPETLERLYATGSGVLPIVDSDGLAAGVVSMEDLLQALACGEASTEPAGTNGLYRR
jgi:CBS domain-containing protein